MIYSNFTAKQPLTTDRFVPQCHPQDYQQDPQRNNVRSQKIEKLLTWVKTCALGERFSPLPGAFSWDFLSLGSAACHSKNFAKQN